MSGKFLVSLSDINMDRLTFRNLGDLGREMDWRLGSNYLERLEQLLPRIPAVERDVIELYYFHNKKQDAIARILNFSQQAVSHRLHSAYRRIIFMLQQPEVTAEQMQEDLALLISNPFTVKVLCDFAKTSSQTVTARNLGVPQQRICWHLHAGLRTMRESLALDAVFYVKYFDDLRQHRNILREVPAGRRKRRDHGNADTYRHLGRGRASGYGRPGLGEGSRESSR